MDAKTITYGETGLDRLVQLLRASGQPLDLTTLTQRYLEMLRDMVVSEDQRATTNAG